MTLYLAVGFVGFLLVVVSGLLGGHHGGDHHLDLAGHDAGDMHLDADHDAGHEGDNGPSVFSLMAIAFFLLAFGGVGALATNYGMSPYIATLPASVGGVVAWWLAYLGLKFLHNQQTNSTVTNQQLTASIGKVVMAIPEGDIGKVCFIVGTQQLELIARSDDGFPIAYGEEVQIVGQAGEIHLVRKLQTLPSWRN